MEASNTRSYAKWRMASLIGIHVLFIAHFVHWKLRGQTLAPLEFNEVLYTIHQGIVTAGFLLMAVVMVATLVFGRFFCSWGCHLLALQDAAGWLMDKLRIKRHPVRSRTLIWVPLVVMFYLFIWPQITRLWKGAEVQALHVVRSGGAQWSSFTTDDMWRNLPPPGVAVFTFFVCGFAIVYLLGSRGFCFQACPYGALFSLADQVAPGRIVLAKDCSQCGLCTKACTSDILVHRELALHGMVTNPRCLKDLDCIAACPENAVQFGFRTPPLFRKGHPMGAYGGRFATSLGEDLAMLVLFLVGMYVYRGLYDSVPFLLAVALALCTGYLFVMGFRLLRYGAVQLRGITLKMDRRLRPAGVAFAVGCSTLVLFFVHSAYVQYHTLTGVRSFQRLAAIGSSAPDRSTLIDRTIDHYEHALSAGFAEPADRRQELASLHLLRGDVANAHNLLTAIVAEHPGHIEANYRLGVIERDRGDVTQAKHAWQRVLAQGRPRSGSHDDELLLRSALELGALYVSEGGFEPALAVYRSCMARLPGKMELLLQAGALESRLGMTTAAIAHYEEALRINEPSAVLHNNLAALYMRQREPEQALPHFERLAELAPGDAHVRYTVGVLHARAGRNERAREALNAAVRLDPADQRSTLALAALDQADLTATTQPD